ncbi:MAG: molecular chaperone DnaJ [Candidatus Gracilibacteria bacterium]|nr:molecular chaperone DnaJ [Candidatus Gracilibacteria bacterium]
MSKRDYYEILGVAKAASDDEIKKAYRKLSKQHHPDVNKEKGAEAKFKEINEAYQVLSDKQKRTAYDQFGHAGAQGFNGAGGGAQGFDFSGFDFGGGGFGDIFENFFGGGFGGGRSNSRTGGPRRGGDLEIQINISFEEAVFGTSKELSITKAAVCDHCKGNGAEPGTKIKECATCGGSGRVKRTQNTVLGQIVTSTTCPDCRGQGKINEQDCTKCHGQKRVRAAEDIKFNIPAGVDDGSTIRLAGKGEAGVDGGSTGDLYVTILVSPSKQFKRQGYDIVSDLKISVPQAVLGDEIEIKTIYGDVQMKVPAGIESGKVLRIKDKGVQKVNSTQKGDHLVRITVDIPKKLSKAEKELYENLAELGGKKLKGKKGLFG